MRIPYKLHMLHRCWRYRLRTEKESIQYLLSKKIQATTAIDIGANHGIYSYWLSKQVGKEGKAIAFEPQPELIQELELLKQSFKLDNLSIINKGLSDRNGCLRLHRAKVGHGGASFEYTNGDRTTIDVDVIRLDDYFENKSFSSNPILFIKADVEGHELKVFIGAKETILKHKPILLFECHQAEADKGELFLLLTEYGYKGFFFYGQERIDYTKYSQYPYRKKSELHRNYIFLDKKISI